MKHGSLPDYILISDGKITDYNKDMNNVLVNTVKNTTRQGNPKKYEICRRRV